jgi:hypothetical protein
MQNWSVKDDIREYWTIRAETYDLIPSGVKADSLGVFSRAHV